MKALILEEDILLADLLETIVGGLYPGGNVFVTGSVASALEHWRENGADLIITGWNLPDGSGLDVARVVREKDKISPIVLISARTDRESVRQAGQHGISDYIIKPFEVTLLHERLGALVDQDTDEQELQTDVEQLLRTSVDKVIQLPCKIDTAGIIKLMQFRQDLSPSQLAERWKEEVALTSRLLDVANNASFKKTGRPVRNLRDGIATLGVDMSFRQAVALSLDISGQLRDPRLAEKAEAFIEIAKKVAYEAERMATRVETDRSEIYVAALLSRVGELGVLKVMQQLIDRKGSISDDQVESGLAWAPTYGNRLKVQWHLPLQLRELIGAVHVLPHASTHESMLVMRSAGLLARGEGGGEECLRLLSRLGLNEHT
ncbi:response regulator [Marinobacter vulgaris]|uniref:Response regulator n=1 Tax=Marinobacter vulgaris TaxID=1928331 RepID=A0A2V3ZL64_9GAMM|nr:response regulator [Marinobacter vulgaris]PXX91804.1 response regulator [Marinobacter vulgaris]TSJ70688.1 response regulator [Marinobacter vulgaris]